MDIPIIHVEALKHPTGNERPLGDWRAAAACLLPTPLWTVGGREPLFLVRLLSQLQTALLDVCLQPGASISVVLWSQTHQNILFFRSSFVSKYIHTESREDCSVWGAFRTREIWEKAQRVSCKGIVFSSEWIPPKLVVCLEMTAIARTVAEDPLLAYFAGMSSDPGKLGAGNFMAQKMFSKT